MLSTTLSARVFNQDSGRAKKAALDGPVFITDRGTPSHVLLSIEQYRALTEPKQNLLDLLSMPGDEYIEFDIPKLDWEIRPVEFD